MTNQFKNEVNSPSAMTNEGVASASGATRRDFLSAAGALVVSVAGGSLPMQALAQTAGTSAAAANAGVSIGTTLATISALKPALKADELDSWVAIQPDGSVVAYYGKVDLGQSLDVAIAQIVAEELDVSYRKVSIVMGNTATSLNQGGASSALGIQGGAKPLRNAAAEARRILLNLASEKLNVPVAQLSINDGEVSVKTNPAQKVTYAELIGGKFFNSKVEWNKQIGNPLDVKGLAKPKSPADYKVVGQSLPRNDVAWKVFGTGGNIADVKVPGMLHARVIRTPVAGGLAEKVDESSIKHIKGAKVVREKNFLAVVAPREWDAVQAARALKVTWSASPKPFPEFDKLHEHIKQAPTKKRSEDIKNGDVNTALSSGLKVVEAEYLWPFQSHASMGPASAVADVKADKATIWTGSQKPHYARDGVAALLKMPVDSVEAIWVQGPGSYGRNDAGDAVLDAAMISKMVGQPVRVQGMRHDGTAWDPKAPASVHRARAAIDANGKVVAYDFTTRAFSRATIDSNESDPRDSLVGMELGLPPKGGVTFGTPEESYAFDNKMLAWEVIPDLIASASPMRTSHMRDPVGLQIQFASEQFIDELAYATGEDPIAFRIKYAKAPRDIAALKAVAEKSGWQPRGNAKRDFSGNVLTGRGIAYAQRAGTIVAVVAEIEVNRKTGRIWGRKFTVAHDCGLIVNPQGLRYTIEGGLVQALSRTLYEEVQFTPDQVKSVDWNSYPILEIKDTPEVIDIVLINRPEAPPTGAGEATCRVLPAAVANAFFDATGVRMRQAPLNPARVKAILAKA
jgi:CO/xanthine dehydrogenase Mo-binding subunit